jgi:hypothetical protein
LRLPISRLQLPISGLQLRIVRRCSVRRRRWISAGLGGRAAVIRRGRTGITVGRAVAGGREEGDERRCNCDRFACLFEVAGVLAGRAFKAKAIEAGVAAVLRFEESVE